MVTFDSQLHLSTQKIFLSFKVKNETVCWDNSTHILTQKDNKFPFLQKMGGGGPSGTNKDVFATNKNCFNIRTIFSEERYDKLLGPPTPMHTSISMVYVSYGNSVTYIDRVLPATNGG